MNRRQILAEVLAHLEAERFQPVEPRPAQGLEPITKAQAARNLATLADAISDDPTVVAWVEESAA